MAHGACVGWSPAIAAVLSSLSLQWRFGRTGRLRFVRPQRQLRREVLGWEQQTEELDDCYLCRYIYTLRMNGLHYCATAVLAPTLRELALHGVVRQQEANSR